MSEWKLIESAPTNGEEMIVFGDGFTYVGCIENGRQKIFTDCTTMSSPVVFTHWMPMPRPPAYTPSPPLGETHD